LKTQTDQKQTQSDSKEIKIDTKSVTVTTKTRKFTTRIKNKIKKMEKSTETKLSVKNETEEERNFSFLQFYVTV